MESACRNGGVGRSGGDSGQNGGARRGGWGSRDRWRRADAGSSSGRRISRRVDFTRPVYFLSQTTQSIALFERLADEMRAPRGPMASQVVVHDTICRQVANREGHLAAFARAVRRGDFRFRAANPPTGRCSARSAVPPMHAPIRVEEAAELRAEWFEGGRVGGDLRRHVDGRHRWLLMQRVADAIGCGEVRHRPYLSAGLHRRRIACGGFREGFSTK